MIRLLAGDCRDVLATLPAESVQCVVTSPPYYALRSYLDAAHPDKHREIGSEATPDEYLATMVQVFREVRRVLRRDGTCWVNMGDSYAANTSRGSTAHTKVGLREAMFGVGNAYGKAIDGATARSVPDGLKPKDLLLMPARLALALQADGWWVRSAIVWAKPNPMPESVTDRPTSAYEMVYLLTRSARYYYDADAVREERLGDVDGASFRGDCYVAGIPGKRGVVGNQPAIAGGRNLRNVWTIATSPFSAAHFATFPPELAERCIKAGTSERGCCPACGAPWVRVTERMSRGVTTSPFYAVAASGGVLSGGTEASTLGHGGKFVADRNTTGWRSSCECDGYPDFCTVLDPFAGAGTTLLVADRLQRHAIGIELNVDYTRMAMERCRADAPLFTSFPSAADPEDERMADLFTDMAAD